VGSPFSSALPSFGVSGDLERGLGPVPPFSATTVMMAPNTEDEMAGFDALIRATRGELLFVYAPEWVSQHWHWSMMDVVARSNPALDRPVRTIFPCDVTQRPDLMVMIQRGVELGDNVRLCHAPPSRMAVLGDSTVVIPTVWGAPPASRVVIHSSSVASALRSLFEELWERSVPLHGDKGSELADDNKEILRMLAAGMKDEAIARRLGLSLRTVRRRVADLMAELNASTRFVAGVEAVRRGWL
jgi:DNA-binding CsgD family transcriptional regulator